MAAAALPAPLPYIRAYDGIRAGAVLLVMFSHWPHGHWQIPLGWVGVQVFFVLSGLLITRLLVADRGRPLGGFLRRFYWRRTLRIAPLYYGYLLLVGGTLLALAAGTRAPPEVLRNAAAVRTDGAWLLTYLYNWQDLIHWFDGEPNSQNSRYFNHLWSLSVEEQFYLVFPVVVWAVPRRRLRAVLLALVLGTPLLRAGLGEVLRAVPAPPATWAFFLNRATPFHLDALALGGLLALGTGAGLRHPGRWLLATLAGGAVWNGAVTVGLHALAGRDWPSWRWLGYEHPLLLYKSMAHAPYWLRPAWAVLPTLVSAQAALLLVWAARPGSAAGRYLRLAPARYVGRISYGLYVWHMPLTLVALHRPVYAWLQGGWLAETAGLLAFLAATLVVASASYYGFERWFLRLKDQRVPPPAAPAPAPA